MFGIKSDTDFHQIGQGPRMLHFGELKAVIFSNVFINEGMSCLSIPMYSLGPKSF